MGNETWCSLAGHHTKGLLGPKGLRGPFVLSVIAPGPGKVEGPPFLTMRRGHDDRSRPPPHMSHTRGVHVPNEPVSRYDFNHYIDRHDHQHSELDGRLARDMVPMAQYLADQRAFERNVRDVERDLEDKADQSALDALKSRVAKLEERPANVRNYLIALAGLGLTLLGIVVSAYFSARGAQ